MNYVQRDEWGAGPARSEVPLRRDRVTRIFLHHTTGGQQHDKAAWLRSIQRFHQETRGWSDIAYNILVDADGVAYIGRGFGLTGAHTKGYNSTAVAVAYLGDGDRAVPPDALRTIRAVMEEADRWMERPLERLPHRAVGATACPGDLLAAWLKAGMPVDDPHPAPDVRPLPPHPADETLRSPVPDLRDGWRRHLARLRGRRR